MKWRIEYENGNEEVSSLLAKQRGKIIKYHDINEKD